MLQPNYEVHATLIASDNNQNLGMTHIFETTGFRPQSSNIQNHIGILSSYSLTRQTLENLDWRVRWYEDLIFSDVDLYKYAPFNIENFNPLLNLPGVRINLTPIDNNSCLLSVSDKLNIGGVEKNIEFETKYKYGDSLQNEYFNFILNKVSGRPIELEKKYSFTFNDLNKLTDSYLERLEIA
jgi:hypothetical protein